MSHRTRRLSALAGVAALTIGSLVTAAPAQAHPAGDRAVEAGATWLEGQLTDGLVHNDLYGFDDLGLSADVAFALDAVGGRASAVGTIAHAVAPHVKDWYSYGTSVYAGSAAKATVLAQVAGLDATNFGGQDLQGAVEGAVATAAPIVGRVQNVDELDYSTTPPTPTDSLNVISQGWAARGLAAQGSSLADEVEAFLLDQQCDAGFFRYGMTVDKTAPEQGCVDGVDSGHLDTTALTVVNLLATPTRSAQADAAVLDAVDWLETQQAADGSFSAGGTEGVNANTTGLAAWALAEAGDTARATRAATWLRGLQVADLAPCSTTLTADNGAVAYSSDALASSRDSASITTQLQDQYRRTTAQALPALAQVPSGSGPLAVTAPTTAPEKSSVTVTISGLGAGEAGCVTLGSTAKSVTGTGGDVTVDLDLPAGAATHTVRLITVDGTAAVAAVTTTVPAPAPSASPAPVAGTPSVGDLVAKRVVKVRRNRFRLRVTCESSTACQGRIVVRTNKKVLMTPHGARRVLIAKKSYSVAPGESAGVVLRVRRPARSMLAKGRVKVRAVASAPEVRRTVTKFWLKKAR